MRHLPTSIQILLLIVIIERCPGFTINSHNGYNGKLFYRHLNPLEATKTIQNHDSLGGVDSFENWFWSKVKFQKNNDMHVRHSMFQNGRGLEYVGPSNNYSDDKLQNLIQVPLDMVLKAKIQKPNSQSTKYNNNNKLICDWDAQLALSLLKQCQLGDKSQFHGYCSLLTQGQKWNPNQTPPSTAPHTIRNWTASQKQYLNNCARGRKLLAIEHEQSQSWTEKYNAISNNYSELIVDANGQSFTLSHFIWAMEAVYSRAFRGKFGISFNDLNSNNGDTDTSTQSSTLSSILSQLSTSFIPFAFGGLILNSFLSSNSINGSNLIPETNSDFLFFVLAIIAFSPVLLDMINDNFSNSIDNNGIGAIDGGGNDDCEDVVMLPFIDSGNHNEASKSKIEFDPLRKLFTLSIIADSNSLVLGEALHCDDHENKKENPQLYISYGKKSDPELLLNYGFLPGVDFLPHNQNSKQDDYDDEFRKRLAEAFCRNSKEP